jgi:hypothetical protein
VKTCKSAKLQIRVDPVGFEPTISCLQSRRLPAWPRAPIAGAAQDADERIRTSTPCRAIDPKSIASAIPPRRLGGYRAKRALPPISKWLVPPILSTFQPTVICLSEAGFNLHWRFVDTQVLPALTRTAATRFHRSRTLSPCSQSHARLADPIAGYRWWALTPPFQP